MADSYSSKLQIWEGWVPPLIKQPVSFSTSGERGLQPTSHPLEVAEQLFAAESLSPHRRRGEQVEPFSLQWFLDIEAARYGRHNRWIPRLLEFSKHKGDRLLCLGDGLGTDWVQFARHGAEVMACSPTAEHRVLVQRHFDLRGLRGQFLNGHPTAVPVDSSSIDVVCLNSLFHSDVDPVRVVEEVYRVLKPGGKVLAILRAKYDVEYLCYRWLPFQQLWRRHVPRATRLGAPFSGRGARRLFGRFVEHNICKRHLRRADVPHLWRWLPLPVLERVMGQLLIIKAFKPLSAAISTPVAA
jgi:SAM-dependent methyltransferase